VGEKHFDMPLPGSVVLVCHTALSMAADAETVCHKHSAVLIVLAAHVMGANYAMMAQAGLVVSGRFRHGKVFPEPDVVQGTQLVQRHADGIALLWSEYHSGVPCLPAFRFPALENSADIIPSSFVL
jgi:hypothetical protein